MKRVSKSESVAHVHLGSEPNDRDGMSDIAFCIPAIWSGVRGEARVTCRRSASARSSCIAIGDFFEAIRSTHDTVGVLSLYKATWHPSRSGHIASIASHRSKSPAISRSLFVRVPVGLASEITAAVMSGGHCTLNTVSGTFLFSPIMTPPAPKDDASVIPT